MEFLRESIPDPEEPSRMAREYDIMERIFELPEHQKCITSRLAELLGGLRAAEEAERRGSDLIVLGSSPRWRRQSRFFSPTVDFVLRNAPCEVLVVAFPDGVFEE